MIDVTKESSKSSSSLWWPVAYDLILHVGAYSLLTVAGESFFFLSNWSMLWASVKFTRMPHEIGKQKYVNQHVNLGEK